MSKRTISMIRLTSAIVSGWVGPVRLGGGSIFFASGESTPMPSGERRWRSRSGRRRSRTAPNPSLVFSIIATPIRNTISPAGANSFSPTIAA